MTGFLSAAMRPIPVTGPIDGDEISGAGRSSNAVPEAGSARFLQLYDTEIQHCIGDFDKAGYIGTVDIVAFAAKTRGRVDA